MRNTAGVELRPRTAAFSWVAEDDRLADGDDDPQEMEMKKERWLKKKKNTKLIKLILADVQQDKIESLLQSGVSPMVRCQQSMATACHIAALRGRTDIIQVLLERSKKLGLGNSVLEARDRAGRQPHHLAAKMGHSQTLKDILKAEPQLKNSQVIEDKNLDRIIREDQLDSFLHNHTEVSCLMPYITEGSTALHIASKYNINEIVKFLLSINCDPNIKDSEGFTPLDVVSSCASQETMRSISRAQSEIAIVEKLTSPNTATDGDIFLTTTTLKPDYFSTLRSSGGKSPKLSRYSLDVLGGTMDIVSSLITVGGKLSEDRNHKCSSTLHKFVENHNIRAIKEFLRSDNGFDNSDIRKLVNAIDVIGQTPLHRAVEMNQLEALNILLNADDSGLNIQDEGGRTPLHIAVQKEWTRGIEVLLEHNADIGIITKEGETVIHIAALMKNHIILRTLLERTTKGVVNQRDTSGYTALFRAIAGGSVECSAVLLDFCKPRKYLNDASSLLHVAVKSNVQDVLRLLMYKINFTDKDINQPNREGLTPLHLAVQNNCINSLDFLLELKTPRVNIQATKDDGGTILHIAAQLGRHEALKKILNYGFDFLMSTKDKMDQEPLILAAKGGHAKCVELLLKKGANIAAKDRRTDKIALELIHYNIPHSVRILEDIMDSFMSKCELREDNPNFSVELNYKFLLADLKENDRQLGVIEAFMKCSHERLRQKLFLHPLTKSFLFFKWSQLKIFFRILIFIFIIHIFTLTGLCIVSYVHPIPYIIWPWKSTILLMNIFIFFLEYLHSRADKRYLMDLETWVKWSVIITSTVLCVLPNYPWLRYLASVSVLLSWIQLLFLIARFPRWGLRVLMFFEVAVNVFQVLATFLFLIVGFAFAFLILFEYKHPFTSVGSTFFKTFIMMVELDYNGTYGSGDGDADTAIGILGRILYLCFVVLVVMVLTNLMVSMSVSDVAELETQGRSKGLEKQASFLVVFEKILYRSWLCCCLPESFHRSRSAPENIIVWPNKKTKDGQNPLPIDLKKLIRQTVLNKEDEEEETSLKATVQKLAEDVQEMFELIKAYFPPRDAEEISLNH